jgi:hypothetical protein
VESVVIYYVNAGVSFLFDRTNPREYLTLSNLFIALVALLNLTSLSLKDDWRDSFGFTGDMLWFLKER